MKTIEVVSRRHGRFVATIDDVDAALTELKWHIMYTKKRYDLNGVTERASPKFYLAHTFSDRKTRQIQRVIMNPEAGMMVDHIDGNTMNNCRSNLRVISRRENTWNRGVDGNKWRSIYKGVTFEKRTGKYYARIRINGRAVYGPHRANEEDAALDYNLLAIRHFGDKARLNVIPGR